MKETEEKKSISRKTVIIASIIAFFAWALSVYDYIMFGNLLPVIQHYYGWTDVQVSLLATLVSIGTLITSLTVGPIVDYLGRVKGIMATTGGAALSSFLTGIGAFLGPAIAYPYLAIVRALSGYGYSEQAANTAYLSEIFPAQKRGFWYSFVQGGWPIGVLLASAFILALHSLPWHYLFFFATIPALIMVILAWRLLPETPRFKHIKEVRKLLKEGKLNEAKELMKTYEVDLEKTKSFTYSQLFSKDLRRHTIFLSMSFFLNWMGIEVLVVLATFILTEAKGISFTSSLTWLIISNALAYVGYVTHGFIGDKIGRRETIMIGWIIAGISYITMLFVSGFYPIVISYTIGLFFFIGAYAALFAYMGESFPTRARGTGVAFVNAMGPLGAIVGAGLLTALLAIGINIDIAALLSGALPALISGVTMLGANRVLPGKELEEIKK